MPRTGKGGRRTGTPGATYANRTDLQSPEAITAASGQEYGARSEQQAAQRAMPIAPQQVAVSAAGGAQATPTAPVTPSPVAAPTAVGPAVSNKLPGELPFLEPTTRPDEPITHGAALGPGAGPEVLSTSPNLVSEEFAQMARGPGSSALMSALAAAARSMGV